jgi:hypothetical protein
LALAAVGTLTKEDYEKSIEPILDHARRTRHRVRLLIEIGPEYDGHTAGALWEKAVNASRSPSLLRLLDGYAVVTDLRWLHQWRDFMAFLLPFPMRVFGIDERATFASRATTTAGSAVSH